MGDSLNVRAPLSPETFSAAVTAVTTAFGDPTRRDIYLFAREADESVTAGEVAEQFALHPNVARHHLDKLAAAGYLHVSVEQVHASAGRPSKRYQASTKEMELQFPARRDDLLIVLLGHALALVPPEQAEAMAEEVGHEYGLSLANDMAPGSTHRSFRAALHAVAEAFTAHGFAAHAEDAGRLVGHHRRAVPVRDRRHNNTRSSAPSTAAW